MLISVAQKDAARAAAVQDHIVRHAADVVRLLQNNELAICYQQQPAIREVIELTIDHIAHDMGEQQELLMPIPAEETARSAAAAAHIVRHAADALRLLRPQELVICYQQQPSIRRVIDLAIDQIAYTLSEHRAHLDAWRAAQAVQAAIEKALK